MPSRLSPRLALALGRLPEALPAVPRSSEARRHLRALARGPSPCHCWRGALIKYVPPETGAPRAAWTSAPSVAHLSLCCVGCKTQARPFSVAPLLTPCDCHGALCSRPLRVPLLPPSLSPPSLVSFLEQCCDWAKTLQYFCFFFFKDHYANFQGVSRVQPEFSLLFRRSFKRLCVSPQVVSSGPLSTERRKTCMMRSSS